MQKTIFPAADHRFLWSFAGFRVRVRLRWSFLKINNTKTSYAMTYNFETQNHLCVNFHLTKNWGLKPKSSEVISVWIDPAEDHNFWREIMARCRRGLDIFWNNFSTKLALAKQSTKLKAAEHQFFLAIKSKHTVV